MFEGGPEFIKVKGGWINPVDIAWVQTSKQDERLVSVSLPGLDKPINLGAEDSANVVKYLDEHTWISQEELQGFDNKGELEDAV